MATSGRRDRSNEPSAREAVHKSNHRKQFKLRYLTTSFQVLNPDLLSSSVGKVSAELHQVSISSRDGARGVRGNGVGKLGFQRISTHHACNGRTAKRKLHSGNEQSGGRSVGSVEAKGSEGAVLTWRFSGRDTAHAYIRAIPGSSGSVDTCTFSKNTILPTPEVAPFQTPVSCLRKDKDTSLFTPTRRRR
eukprot:1359101-Amorphochlora_amoeboformis.AAC.1